MGGMKITRGIFIRIPENIFEVVKRYHFNIPGKIISDSGEFLRSFRGMFEKIAGHVIRDSGKRSRRFRGKFKKIAGNV